MTYRRWNAWIQLINGLDREFSFSALDNDVEGFREFLANNDNVKDFDIGEEIADWDLNDVREELASWIDSEI